LNRKGATVQFSSVVIVGAEDDRHFSLFNTRAPWRRW